MSRILFRYIAGFISKITGHLVQLRFPFPLNIIVLGSLASLLGISFKQSKKPLAAFHCFQDIFTRELQEQYRPLSSAAIICPCDSILLNHYHLGDDPKIVTKNTPYSIQSLLRIDDTFSHGHAINLYLSPRMCHRFVMPQDGILEKINLIPGAVFPVNPRYQALFPTVFLENERVVFTFSTNETRWYLVAIAALNVGKIALPWHDPSASYLPPHAFKKGEELGCFEMGSSIVLVFPNQDSQRPAVAVGSFLHVNSPLFQANP